MLSSQHTLSYGVAACGAETKPALVPGCYCYPSAPEPASMARTWGTLDMGPKLSHHDTLGIKAELHRSSTSHGNQCPGRSLEVSGPHAYSCMLRKSPLHGGLGGKLQRYDSFTKYVQLLNDRQEQSCIYGSTGKQTIQKLYENSRILI